MNGKLYVLLAGLAVLLLLSLWRIDNVQGKLRLEQTEHNQTKVALADAIEKGNGWKAAYHEALSAAEAHKEATEACLNREVEAREAAEERSTILQAAQPRTRTDNEQKQVVDDATRKRSADRLNRPL